MLDRARLWSTNTTFSGDARPSSAFVLDRTLDRCSSINLAVTYFTDRCGIKNLCCDVCSRQWPFPHHWHQQDGRLHLIYKLNFCYSLQFRICFKICNKVTQSFTSVVSQMHESHHHWQLTSMFGSCILRIKLLPYLWKTSCWAYCVKRLIARGSS